MLASGSDDKTIKLWDVQSGKVNSTLPGHRYRQKEEANATCPVTERGHSGYVRAVSWSPDGTMLASGSDDKTIKLWDVQSGKVSSTLTGHRYRQKF